MTIIDNRTPNFNLPLPYIGNALDDDVVRLAAAFTAIDTEMQVLAVAEAVMVAMQRDMGAALAAVSAAAQLVGIYHVTATTTVGAKIAFAPAIPITVDPDALLIIQADGLVVL